MCLHRAFEVAGQALQEGVARRVPERVVVALEAVQVEERERVGAALLGFHARLQVVHQPAPVAEPGERVGDGLMAAGLEHRRVGPEGDRHAEHDRHQGGGREQQGDRVQAIEVVVDEQCEADEGEATGTLMRRQPPRLALLRRPGCHAAAAISSAAAGHRALRTEASL